MASMEERHDHDHDHDHDRDYDREENAKQSGTRWRSSTNSAVSYRPVPNDDNSSDTFAVPRKPLPPQTPYKAPVAKVSDQKAELKPTASKNHTSFRLAVGSWWTEVLASVVSILSLIAIVVVLRVYDGRSIDELHLPRNLSLNGLIALIATFDRLFLVIPLGSILSQEAWLWFAENHGRKNPRSRLRDLDRSDAASRGAWGSLLFVFTSPRRYLSVIGSLIMILSLAIPTFTQQLILQQNVELRDDKSALQPGNIPRNEYYNLFSGAPSQGRMSPGLTMIGAIYSGLLVTNVDPVPAYCPSGNCTWPATPSLAICGDCAPIEPILTSCESLTCNYSVPSGSEFQLANFTASAGEGIGFQVVTTQTGQHWNSSKLDRLYVANFDMIGIPYGTLGVQTYRQQLAVSASECALWICVNTYNTTVRLGNQTQHTVSSFADIAVDPLNASGTYTFNYPDESSGLKESDRASYTCSGFAWLGLSQSFANWANGTVQIQPRAFLPSSDVINAIWAGTGNQSAWMANMVNSMSNVVRTNNQTSRSQYNGTAFVPGIQIDWWWIVLPAVTVAATNLLLLVVIVRTIRSPVKSWRSRPLNFLFSEVDDDIKSNVTENDSGKEIGPGVDKQIVTLTRNEEKSWMFTSQQNYLRDAQSP